MSVAQHHPEVQRPPERRPLPPSRRTRLTLFQQEMLLWEASHPYNAAHVLRISGAANVAELRESIEAVCREAGIGELDIDRRGKTLNYQPLRALDVRTAKGGATPETVVSEIVDEGMNAHFPDGPHHPIRWAVVSEDGDAAHHLILMYHHVASDAHGIEALLGAILRRYLVAADSAHLSTLSTDAPGLAEWFLHRARHTGVVRSLLKATAMSHRMRKCHRMPDDERGGSDTRHVKCPAPDGLLGRLMNECHLRGAGVNDAFMAAMVSAIAERTTERHVDRHRRKIAVGTVLTERRRVSIDLRNYFGVCLSDMLALLERPDAGIDDVLLQVAEQTRRQKGDRAYAAALSMIRLMNVKYLWPIARIRNHRLSYRRLFPICGGVSTMFVNEGRFGEASRRVTRYYRVCPPGPMSPMVLAPTVYRGHLELCMTYRPACRTAEQAADMLGAVRGYLGKIASGSSAL